MTVSELPLVVRLAFSAALLGSLALAELLSDAFYVPLLVLLVFLFVVLPIIARSFGRGRGPMPRASGRTTLAFAAFLTFLATVEVVLIPDFGLGPTFWIVAIIIPSMEFLGYLTRREARPQT